jgi:AMIN domain
LLCAGAKRALSILTALAALCAAPRYAAGARHNAEVQSVRVVPSDNGPVLEIVSTRPLTPQFQIVESPLRLVVDLPDSTLNTVRRRIPFRDEQIKSIRMDQYQADVTRVVVDLGAPVKYTWDAMGNRLNIRIRHDEQATAKPPSVTALSYGPQPAVVPVAVGTSGSLIETGSRVSSGSSISAGEEMAILRLSRGGEVHVCPGTTVSVSTSPNGKDLMLGMNQGAMETHYGLQESVDSVLTADFRIVLPGPGEFNLAISADAHGDTCVGSLQGSTSSVVIAELLGNGTYEVKPDQQVAFRRGRLDTVEPALAPCGCPGAQQPVLRASADPPSVIPEDRAGQKLQLGNSDASPSQSASPSMSPLPDPASTDKPKADEKPMKVSLEAPLIFSGRELAKARASAPPAPVSQVAALPLTTRAADPMPAVVVLPPAPDPTPARKGFFGKVKHFFGGMFH